MEACGLCTASERMSVTAIDPIDVIGTWSHIEKPSAVNARVEPALVLGRGYIGKDCLGIAGDWVSDNENERREQQ